MTGRMRILAATAAVALGAGAGAASAQGLGLGGGNFYVKGFGGATFPDDKDFNLDSRTGGASFDSGLDFDTGYTLGIAGGYALTENIAVELEYAYRNADANLKGVGGDDVKTESNAIMANGIYTFHGIGPNQAFRPYVGAGLGAADLNVEKVGSGLGGDLDSDYNFAYQVMTGVSYAVAPNFDLLGEVRFFGINDQGIENDDFRFKSKYQTFDLLVGAAYHF